MFQIIHEKKRNLPQLSTPFPTPTAGVSTPILTPIMGSINSNPNSNSGSFISTFKSNSGKSPEYQHQLQLQRLRLQIHLRSWPPPCSHTNTHSVTQPRLGKQVEMMQSQKPQFFYYRYHNTSSVSSILKEFKGTFLDLWWSLTRLLLSSQTDISSQLWWWLNRARLHTLSEKFQQCSQQPESNQHHIVVCDFTTHISCVKKLKFSPCIQTWKLRDPAIAGQFQLASKGKTMIAVAVLATAAVVHAGLLDAATEVCGLCKKHPWKSKTWWWNEQVDKAICSSSNPLLNLLQTKVHGSLNTIKELETRTYRGSKVTGLVDGRRHYPGMPPSSKQAHTQEDPHIN